MSVTVIDSHDLPAARLLGQIDFRERETPSIEIVPGALYIPPSGAIRENSFGLYDTNNQLVRNSIDLRVSGRRFDQPDETSFDRRDAEMIDGTHYYIGILFEEFGHFITECTSRLWPIGMTPADQRSIVYHGDLIFEQILEERPFMAELFGALGVPRERLRRPTSPTIFETMIVPQATIRMKRHIYRQILLGTHAVTRGLLGDRTLERSSQPLYLSRTGLPNVPRKILNEAEIEAALAARGVRICHPEQLSFREQIILFNTHRTLIGVVGSAMHTMLYSLDQKDVHYIQARTWCPSNFPLLDRATGHRATYYFCETIEDPTIDRGRKLTVRDVPALIDVLMSNIE